MQQYEIVPKAVESGFKCFTACTNTLKQSHFHWISKSAFWDVIRLSFFKEVPLHTYIVVPISVFWNSTIAGSILLGSQRWLCSGMLGKLLQWIESSKVHIVLPTLFCYNWPCWWLHKAVISLRFLPIGFSEFCWIEKSLESVKKAEIQIQFGSWFFCRILFWWNAW